MINSRGKRAPREQRPDSELCFRQMHGLPIQCHLLILCLLRCHHAVVTINEYHLHILHLRQHLGQQWIILNRQTMSKRRLILSTSRSTQTATRRDNVKDTAQFIKKRISFRNQCHPLEPKHSWPATSEVRWESPYNEMLSQLS